MRWFGNLKIRTKLLYGFGVGVALTIVLGIIGIMAIDSVQNSYEHILAFTEKRVEALLEAENCITDLRRNVVSAGLNAGNAGKIQDTQSAIDANYADLENHLNTYWNLVQSDTTLSESIVQDRKQTLEALRKNITAYKSDVSDKVIKASQKNNLTEVRATIAIGADIIAQLTTDINKLVDATQDVMKTTTEKTTKEANEAVWAQVIISVLVVLVSVFVALWIAGLMTRPIRALVLSAKRIAEGDFNVNLNVNTKDELGELSNTFHVMSQTLNDLVTDIKTLSTNLDNGILGSSIDAGQYKGVFSEVATGVNKTTSDLINETLYILNTIQSFSKGDFNAPMKVFQNDKILATNIVESIRTQLKAVNTDITMLVQNSLVGNLNTRVDATNFDGDWKTLINQLNALMGAVSEPIAETQRVLTAVSEGDFSIRVTGDYKGDFQLMKNALNCTVDTVSSYIGEVSLVLQKMARQDFDVEITRQYAGDFIEIKDSINNVILVFNEILWEINLGAAQLTSSSKYISDTSIQLANGAVDQAGSVDKLSTTINGIYSHTGQNETNAETANELSSNAKEYVAKSDSYMQDMLQAMQEINESSDDISSVIKIINDISFQTNLLALNAAVEAARAGAYGKGFAVVAEEVRNLAMRSQTAAKQTTDLIEGSKLRVDKGTKIAHITAETLESIVEKINKVSDIVSDIYSASSSQRKDTDILNQETVLINKVTQQNSAMSEEAAASAQQLLSQAEMFSGMVNKFKLKPRA